jgi:hypothetical protein
MPATLALLALLTLAGCAGEHDPDLVSVMASDCAVCHTPDYQMAAAPPHVDIFPTECALCHSNVSWSPATFEHASVANRQCVLCHQANYDGAMDPVHVGSKPTTCQDCHGTIAWKPAIDGAHPDSAFRISGGAHDNIACTQCHDPELGSSSGGMNTDCVGCHTGEHSLSRMDGKHREVSGYTGARDSMGPNFCLLCHPNGRN